MSTFICQRCRHPLRLDESLADLDTTSTDLLMAPLQTEEQHYQRARTNHSIPNEPVRKQAPTHEPASRRWVGIRPAALQAMGAPSSKRDSFPAPSESFVVLSRSQVASNHAASSNTTVARPGASHSAGAGVARPVNPTLSTSSKKPHGPATGSAIPSSGGPTAGSAGTSIPRTVQAPMSGDDTTWQTSRYNSLSHRLKVTGRLFDIMSSKSSVDHPMCQECTDMLLEGLERQLEDVGRERDCYIDFLKNIKDSRVTDEEAEELRKQVEELKTEESLAEKELEEAQKEREQMQQQVEQLERDAEALREREDQFWTRCNEYQIGLQNFQNERDSVNLKYDHDVRQYERLQKTVVYNDAFCISQDGPFGTINGFRLGRLSTHPVEWSEINAAWGQTLLLLYTVANKLRFQFQMYRLVPMGSFSRVEKVDGESALPYELYGSGDFGLNRMFLNRRFDHAMVAILNCLKQLTDYAEKQDKSLRLPYRINKDKIGELSIRMQFNQDELWTKALKYMLTNMKWILVFASRTNITADASSSSETV